MIELVRERRRKSRFPILATFLTMMGCQRAVSQSPQQNTAREASMAGAALTLLEYENSVPSLYKSFTS